MTKKPKPTRFSKVSSFLPKFARTPVSARFQFGYAGKPQSHQSTFRARDSLGTTPRATRPRATTSSRSAQSKRAICTREWDKHKIASRDGDANEKVEYRTLKCGTVGQGVSREYELCPISRVSCFYKIKSSYLDLHLALLLLLQLAFPLLLFPVCMVTSTQAGGRTWLVINRALNRLRARSRQSQEGGRLSPQVTKPSAAPPPSQAVFVSPPPEGSTRQPIKRSVPRLRRVRLLHSGERCTCCAFLLSSSAIDSRF